MILSKFSLSEPPEAAFVTATETVEYPPTVPDAENVFAPFTSSPSVTNAARRTMFPVTGFLPITPSPNSTLNWPSELSLRKYTFDVELTVVMSVAFV